MAVNKKSLQNLKPKKKGEGAITKENAKDFALKSNLKQKLDKIAAQASFQIVQMLDSLTVSDTTAQVFDNLGIPKPFHNRKTLRILQLHKKAENGDILANKLLFEICGELDFQSQQTKEDDVNIVIKFIEGNNEEDKAK